MKMNVTILTNAGRTTREVDFPEPVPPLPVIDYEPRELAVDDNDFELPAKQCDIGRPEGCESCQ